MRVPPRIGLFLFGRINASLRPAVILFQLPEFERIGCGLVQSVPQLRAGRFDARRFPNGELFIGLETAVAREDCSVLGSFTPPDDRLLSTLLLCHTLRKEGARAISAVIPYLAYSRQDRNRPAQSMAARWTGAMTQASGVDRVITIDVHSSEDQRLFPIPLISLSPAHIFASAIREYRLMGATIVAPDEGAIARCSAVRDAAGLPPEPVPYFKKQRTETGIQHVRFEGSVGIQALLVDDILDTGATLILACQRLLCAGVEDIQIMVTHGLFTGDEWRGLWELGVSRIFCTDTFSPAPESAGRIVSLPVTKLLADAFSAQSCVI